jgi:hypothetical protein
MSWKSILTLNIQSNGKWCCTKIERIPFVFMCILIYMRTNTLLYQIQYTVYYTVQSMNDILIDFMINIHLYYIHMIYWNLVSTQQIYIYICHIKGSVPSCASSRYEMNIEYRRTNVVSRNARRSCRENTMTAAAAIAKSMYQIAQEMGLSRARTSCKEHIFVGRHGLHNLIPYDLLIQGIVLYRILYPR